MEKIQTLEGIIMPKQFVEPVVIEVYLDPRESIFIDRIDAVVPLVIQIGLGTNLNILPAAGIIQSIIDSYETISSVVLPDVIPTKMIKLLYPLLDLSVPIHYINNDQNGLSVDAYAVRPGYFIDDINMHHNSDIDRKDNMKHNEKFSFSDPAAVGSFNHITDIEFNDNKFRPINDLDNYDDGFHPMPEEDSLDDIVDGFHDCIEKRTMWTEDPSRMNRLSYLPIAAINGDETFPEHLGGGII